MRQVWIPKYGGVDVLEVREAPDPVPEVGEVRVRVEYSGVNFADITARIGVYADAPKPPMVVGYEVSGVIDAVGVGVEDSWLNQPVMAIVRFGGYSDVVCVPLNQVFRRPDSMSAEEGAAMPVNSVTAYQILGVMVGIHPGETVLIHGAAGGVGWMAVQIAQIMGATVYGTASSHKHEALRELGVKECIDYRKVDFVKAIHDLTDGQGVEVVIDPIGGGHWMRSYRALAPTGRLVMCGQAGMIKGQRRNLFAIGRWLLGLPWLALNPARLVNDNKAVIGINVGRMGAGEDRIQSWFKQILAWYEEGNLKPRIDSVYSFEEASEAHRRLQDRQNIGKVLLKP